MKTELSKEIKTRVVMPAREILWITKINECPCVCVCVCVSHLSRGQLSPIAVREASVMLLQPDTQRICSLWHPLHRLTKPSSVICWDGHTGQMTERWGQDPDSNMSPPRPRSSEYLPYCARLHIDGGEFRAVLLKVFQGAIFQLESLNKRFHPSLIPL